MNTAAGRAWLPVSSSVVRWASWWYGLGWTARLPAAALPTGRPDGPNGALSTPVMHALVAWSRAVLAVLVSGFGLEVSHTTKSVFKLCRVQKKTQFGKILGNRMLSVSFRCRTSFLQALVSRCLVLEPLMRRRCRAKCGTPWPLM